MTSENKKSNAEVVLTFPAGAVRQQDGDFRLIVVGEDKVKWYKLQPVPAEVPKVTALPKGETLLRNVGNKFLFASGSWVEVTRPEKITKTYFQVQRVEHTVLIKEPDALFLKYKRHGDTEWVLNVSAPPKVAPAAKRISGRFSTQEHKRQKEFALVNSN